MNFELKVQAPKNKPVVFNYEELKGELTTALAEYESRIYTEDTIALAKEDRAKLNKLKKAISDERIARKKEYMKPFETFENQAKELCDLIDTASSGIASQIDAFDEKRIAEKRDHIQKIFDEVISNYDLPFITLEKIYNDKWDNKSVTDKAIATEITDICEKAIKDLEVIAKMPNYSFEATESYKESLDLNKALEEGEKIAEITSKKNQATANDQGERYETRFKCMLTVSQALALKQFCKDNGIVLEQI